MPPTALELLRFEGNIEEKGNLLIWTTAQEINHKHFELQRSQDGIHFETIAIIQGKGNSSSLQEYEYLDKSTENGINYYRLLSISTENEQAYSQIIALQRNNLVEIVLSPIPASDYINISLTTPIYEPCEINLYDLTGRIVLNTRYSATQTHQRLELSNLPQGIYTLCLQNSTFFVKRILVIE
ncbi:MAG: T9SS type A sorting domain-containing protein [Sphingobacteriales bacterium]|nr:T9SS type A sorting domain-containing protein [Sphingobacteriales bacterium]